MKFSIRDMILIGVFAALMVVGAKLVIPTPFGVPLTFQLFFAIYTGLLLSAKNALFSQLIYILLGLVGVPVFASGGGPQYIFNPTFGYIIGFLIAALVIAYLRERIEKITFFNILVISILGFSLDYIIGNLYFYFAKAFFTDAPIGLFKIFQIMSLYMVKDFVLVVLAAVSATLVIPVLRKSGYMTKASA